MLNLPSQVARTRRVGQQGQARVPATVQRATWPRRGMDEQVDAVATVHKHRVRDHRVSTRAEHDRLRDAFNGELRERQAFAIAPDVAGNGPFDLGQQPGPQRGDIPGLIRHASTAPANLDVDPEMVGQRVRTPRMGGNRDARGSPDGRGQRRVEVPFTVVVTRQPSHNRLDAIRDGRQLTPQRLR